MNISHSPHSSPTRFLSFSTGVALTLLLGLGLPIIGSLLSNTAFSEWRWNDPVFHTFIEFIGALLSLSLGAMLLNQEETRTRSLYHWVACGLVAMGVLDAFHAFVPPGNTFVWFHSTAVFVGGMLFLLGSFFHNASPPRHGLALPIGIASGVVTLSLGSLVMPDRIPAMVQEGEFTFLARSLNVLGGLGCIMAALRFTLGFRQSGRVDEWLFAIHCLLFGAAGMLFEVSTLWDAGWWWWHVLRLVAYGTGLQCVMSLSLRRMASPSPVESLSGDGEPLKPLVPQKKNLTAWLPMIMVIMVLVVIGVGAGATFVVHQHLFNREGERLALIARSIADRLHQHVSSRKGAVKLLADDPVFLQPDTDAMSTSLARVADTYEFDGLSFLDMDGVVIASSNSRLRGQDLRGELAVDNLYDPSVFQVQDVRPQSLLANSLVLTLLSPVFGLEENRVGSVVAHVGVADMRYIFETAMKPFLDEKDIAAKFEWQLLSQSGMVLLENVLAQAGHANLRDQFVPSAWRVTSDRGGYVEEFHSRRHTPILTGYAKMQPISEVPGFHWGILVRRDKASVLAAVQVMETQLGLLGIAMMFPLVGLLLIIVRRLEKSQKATTQALTVAQFNETRLVQMAQENIDLATRNSLLLDSAAEGIYGLDLDGVTTFVNPAGAWMLGYDPAELIGVPMHPAVHHTKVDGTPYPREDCPMYGAFKEGLVRCVDDEVLWRKDGTSFPVEYASTPQRNSLGEIMGAVVTFRDVTERKQVEADLVEARDQAIEAVRLKSEFLAMMSHEIRTPMNGVLGMTGILLESELTKDQRECAETVKHSADALLTIINDILDFSKIESGKLDMEVIDFDLRIAIEDVLDLMGAKAQNKGLELVGLIYASVPTAVRGDPGRFRQILLNLVGNAIKFTEQGEVVIQVVPETETSENVSIRVDVVDTGIGLTPEIKQRLFQPFSQADGSTTRKYGGTGLGLVICKQLAELMNGTIGVDSQPGHGSRFWFTVCLEKQPKSQHKGDVISSSLNGLRICVVDDNDTNRLLMHHYANAWGMTCLSAQDGPTALSFLKDAVAQEQPCDLLLLDYQMPEMDGMELARHVKADLTLRDVKIVLVSSLGRRGDAAAAKEAGIGAYLTKPLHHNQLHDCLVHVMKGGVEGGAPLITKYTLREVRRRQEGRLLVADDNVVNQKVAVRMLEKLGYRVDVVANGCEAVEAVSRIAYDAVLMDCQMPEMDGYEATREIRKWETSLVARDSSLVNGESTLEKNKRRATSNQRRLPIIAMTANAMQGDRDKCLNAGMDDFVSKPVKGEALDAVLAQWVKPEALPFQEPIQLNPDEHGANMTTNVQPEGLHSLPPLDAETLDGLRDLAGDDPSFLSEVIQQFIHDGPEHVSAIRQAMEQVDADALMKAAHGFKGSCRNMGALPLGELCLMLEEKGRSGDATQLDDAVSQLEREYARVQAALEVELAKTSTPSV